jgi:NitT/TauT family transport system substrate-binding protein
MWKALRTLGVTVLLVAACAPLHAETVKVGISKLFGYPGVPIALARGYFAAEGIDVDLLYFDSAQPIAVGVASGATDFGVAGMSAGFYTLAGHGELRLIASSGGEHPGFHALAYLASNKAYAAGLRSPKDYAGHTVAITQLGTSLHYSLARAAEKFGYSLSAVEVRPLQSNTNVIAALTGNTIDGAVMPETPVMPVVVRGDAKLIGWVSEIAPDFTTGSGLFTRTETANDKGDLVKRFLVAYRHGLRDFHNAFVSPDGKPANGPDAPALLAIMADFTGVPPDQLAQAIPYVDGEGRIATADIVHQIEWYKSQNLMKGDIKAADLIDPRYALPLVASR